jgi:hypothetical protein
VHKKGDKLDCKSYRGICLLIVTYKVVAKIPCDRFLPHANVAVQHYQAGFQSGKSTTDQLFALRQILEKCNEFNITTHHLFMNFKAAYDTIIRNEVYVGMSELNFPTKLTRFTKATLTSVTCCVKTQNDCSESFETQQGLRQGDVLSTLPFNVVLEVIVRRANLQTTGTIYNKETQQWYSIERRSSQMRVKINEQNTKYMIAARNDRTIRDVGQSEAISDKHFEVVKEFVYLGSLMTPTNDVSLEIQRRI